MALVIVARRAFSPTADNPDGWDYTITAALLVPGLGGFISAAIVVSGALLVAGGLLLVTTTVRERQHPHLTS